MRTLLIWEIFDSAHLGDFRMPEFVLLPGFQKVFGNRYYNKKSWEPLLEETRVLDTRSDATARRQHAQP